MASTSAKTFKIWSVPCQHNSYIHLPIHHSHQYEHTFRWHLRCPWLISTCLKCISNVCCHMLSTTDKCWQLRTRFQVLNTHIFQWHLSLTNLNVTQKHWWHVMEEENLAWAGQGGFFVRDVSQSWCRISTLQLLLWVVYRLSNASMPF